VSDTVERYGETGRPSTPDEWAVNAGLRLDSPSRTHVRRISNKDLMGPTMSKCSSITNSWRRGLLAALLLPGLAAAVTAGTAGFVPGVAQASQADYQRGYALGQQQGHKDGYTDGYRGAADYRRGYVAGYRVGYETGFRQGRRAGARDGYEDGQSDAGTLRDKLREQMRDYCKRRGTC
jgi:hypothetical protein